MGVGARVREGMPMWERERMEPERREVRVMGRMGRRDDGVAIVVIGLSVLAKGSIEVVSCLLRGEACRTRSIERS
jgi:hypothetical protein